MFEVFDPDEKGDDSRISRRFPSYNDHNTYRLRNRSRIETGTLGPLSRFAVRREGDLTIGYIADRFGTEVGIIGNGVPRLCLSVPLRDTHLAGGLPPVSRHHAARRGTRRSAARRARGTASG